MRTKSSSIATSGVGSTGAKDDCARREFAGAIQADGLTRFGEPIAAGGPIVAGGPARSQVVSEQTLAGGLRLVLKRYDDGLSMGRHTHGEWRFCLALRGAYTDSWRRGYRTRAPGQLSLHPADEVHTSRFHAAATCFHIELAGSWRDRLLGDGGIAPEPHEFLAGRVPGIAREIYQEFQRPDACSPLLFEGLSHELIAWASRQARSEQAGAAGAGSSRRQASWIAQARDLLHDRFNEPLTLAEIAATLRVHPVHLARTFKRAYGITIGAYVRQIRVEFVCRRLPTGATIADLALQAGFCDQGHLTRVFKRLTGATPAQFRARR